MKLWASILIGGISLCILGGLFALMNSPRAIVITGRDIEATHSTTSALQVASEQASTTTLPQLNAPAYDAKLLQIANLTTIPHIRTIRATSSTPSSTITTYTTLPAGWPVKAAYPKAGALLPQNRIVAYYGNLYSTAMGVLGEYPEAKVLEMLASTTREWAAADPTTPVIPALDYIVIAAQASPGADGMYRARMPASEVAKVVAMAAKAGTSTIVVLDVQVGLSTVQKELPLLAPYLKLPQVHLALDPEFSMKDGAKPGTEIGTMDASDINYAANFLADLVQKNNLPPKILIVHRFTEAMLTNYRQIAPLPEVQIIMDMDGFGGPAKKMGTYRQVVIPEPIQFTGFKLFYKNDVLAGHLMTPAEVLKLSPQPSFIQYQ